jgi:oligosaccharyltransferase complex subunit beta
LFFSFYQDKQPTYSLFFDDLEARGHSLSFFQSDASELVLKHYGEALYDNILLFAPSLEKFPSISFDDISEFIEEGGNVLITGNKEISEELRDFCESLGILFDKKGSEIIDHFNFDSSLDKT